MRARSRIPVQLIDPELRPDGLGTQPTLILLVFNCDDDVHLLVINATAQKTLRRPSQQSSYLSESGKVSRLSLARHHRDRAL